MSVDMFIVENKEKIDVKNIIDEAEIEYCGEFQDPNNWYTAMLEDGRKAYWHYEDINVDPDWELPTFIADRNDEEIKDMCTHEEWKYIPYKKMLLNESSVINDKTGNKPNESGECIVNLALGLSVSGYYDIDKNEITISDNAVVYETEI